MKRSSFPHAIYSTKFCPNPFVFNIAVLTAENYGIQGKGYLHLVASDSSKVALEKVWCWRDTLYDVAWNSHHENFLLVGTGDGHALLADTRSGPAAFGQCKIHAAEVHSVEWVDGKDMLTASWDGTAKLSNPEGRCLAEMKHSSLVYQARQRLGHHFQAATVSADATLRLWDFRQSPVSPASIFQHSSEVLSCDWLPGNPNHIVTGCTSAMVSVWDIRYSGTKPLLTLAHHKQAVRRVLTCPTRPDTIISCGYDFAVRVFSTNAGGCQTAEFSTFHKEFIYGLDVRDNNSSHLLIVDGSWDRSLCLYTV